MVYELVAYNTDCRYSNDVRYREYTNSERRAGLFSKIPKIPFTDSGHGIVFISRPHTGMRLPVRHELSAYVYEQMARLKKGIKEER